MNAWEATGDVKILDSDDEFSGERNEFIDWISFVMVSVKKLIERDKY